MKAVQSNRKRKELVAWIVFLAGSDNILAHLEFTKLSVHVENNRNRDLLAFEQKIELKRQYLATNENYDPYSAF